MSISERWKGHPPVPSDVKAVLPGAVHRLREGGAQLVYAFGSTAADSEVEPGDVDLAVWGLEEDRWAVATDLAGILGTDRIDLIQLEEADPELRYEIIASGVILYSADPVLENRIELSFLRQYQDLAPFRRTQMRYVRARHADYGS
ncbi:MAG: nucleotidyltransferase domain-containing protein [Longimicrobiales bacterium]